MQAKLVVAVAVEAAAPVVVCGAADIHLSDAASASAPLTLIGIMSAAFIYTAGSAVAVASIIVGDPARIADIAISPVYAPPEPRLANPQFSYADGRLARIDYDGPRAKIFAYQNDRLTTLDYSDGFRTRRKSFTYDAAGALASIMESFV